MFQFDQETQTQALNDGHYQGHISPAWNIGANPNGGYLLSVALNAMAQAVPHPDPVTVTTHFLRPGAADTPCTVDVVVIRVGKTLSTVRATLSQQGKTRIEVLAAFSDLSIAAGVDTPLSVPAPDFPHPDECPERTGDLQNLDLAIVNRTDVRLHPDFAVPGQVGRAEMAGWIRLLDERPVGVDCLPLFADAFPPSPLSLLGPIGWVPTLELTVHVLRRPAPGWISARFQTDELNQGRMIESGMLWDAQGNLVAQSRQLGLVKSN